MPRPPRLLLAKSYYHIMTRGNNRNVVFRSPIDYCYYLELLDRYKSELHFDLYHYCLMPNHVHMLIKTQNANDFSLFMKKINLAYFHHYKQNYDWIGHFWQDRFKSQPIGKDEYFIQCGKYIELNPVRAKIVEKPEDYHYSSYNFYVSGQSNHLISEDIFYSELGATKDKRREKYRELIIDEAVVGSYLKPVWGSDKQRYHESRKARYNWLKSK